MAGFGQGDAGVGGRRDLPRRQARRSRQARRQHRCVHVWAGRDLRRIGEQRCDPRDRGLLREREVRLVRHLDRHPQCRLRTALANPTLEQPESAAFERELDVAEVGVVTLEGDGMTLQLSPNGRQANREIAERLSPMGAGDDILPLRIEDDIAIDPRRAGDRVPSEQHAAAGIGAPVPEDHGLDHRAGAQVLRDALPLPVGFRPVAVPGPEHRLGRGAQLCPRVVGYGGHSDNIAIHRVKPAPAVRGEIDAPGCLGQARLRSVVEPKVQDRVHHPRHRHGRPRAHRHEQRVGWIAESAPDPSLHRAEVLPDLGVECRRPAGAEEFVAGFRRDRERRRHGQAEIDSHHGEVGGLAAQQRGDLVRRQAKRRIEVEDEGHGPAPPVAAAVASNS